MSTVAVSIRRLDSGYWHIRGRGPCNWSQPPILTEQAIREHAFPQASEEFLRDAIREALAPSRPAAEEERA